MSLLEQNSTKKGRIKIAIELDMGNNRKYEVKAICDNEIYTKKSNSGHHLPDFYYLVSWKCYPKEENIWKPALAI